MPPHDTAGGGRRKRPFPAAFCSHKPLFFQKGTCYTQIKWMRLPHREAAAEKNEVFCMIIQNALVYTPRHTFARGTLFIRNGRIVPFAAPEAGEEVIDAEGLYALPGLVDIHFHGAMGKDFCDGTEEAIQTLADFEASKGVLAICPATMTYPEEFLNHVMDAAAAHKNGIDGTVAERHTEKRRIFLRILCFQRSRNRSDIEPRPIAVACTILSVLDAVIPAVFTDLVNDAVLECANRYTVSYLKPIGWVAGMHTRCHRKFFRRSFFWRQRCFFNFLSCHILLLLRLFVPYIL